MASKRKYSKAEIILTESENPHCEHGPTVLFCREGHKFFACSAYRSRRLCPFYLDFRMLGRNGGKGTISSSPKEDIYFHHECNQGQAQYFFSEDTLDFLMGLLKRMKVTNILCVGTPSIHDLFKGASHLLDIDTKFDSVTNFTHYNMCNHHFFKENKEYMSHLKNSENLIVICDPPFGVRLELLLNTFTLIKRDWESFSHDGKIEFIFVNPYFSEGKILKLDPNFRMSDFRVEYASHKKFKYGEKSPIRLFTTVDLKEVTLPGGEYKLCSICQKFVFAISKHCKYCNSCDSRDGKPYYHCKRCQKCFKETWSHCSLCSRCHLRGECDITNTHSRKRKL